MVTILQEVGGVQVFGPGANTWKDSSCRTIKGYEVVFDSDVYMPDVDDGIFVLPAHRGQTDYQIHLLETGGALVFKDGRIYVCTLQDNVPCIVTFTSFPSDMRLASL